jgi:hypothetical protein
LLIAGCAHAPAEGLVFGVLGDTPYTEGEIARVDALIGDMNAERLDFVVHLGDIGSSRNACDDAWLQARKQQFARLKHKLVVLPGDNEWSDCKDQVARLAAWRRLFCAVPLAVERQPGEYCEHMRWQAGAFLFVTLNVQGSNNNLRRDADEHASRTKVVNAWLDESAGLAQKRKLGLVVMMQANPFITLPRDGYESLRERLRRLGETFAGKVLLVHGDTHTYHDDEPMPGLRRLETWGSPIVSWIRGEVEGGELRFSLPRYR